MRTVLITGVTGFVGTSLVKYFNERKDLKIIGKCRDLANAKTKLGSTLQLVTESSSALWDQWSVDVVIHLAGIAHDLSGKFKPEDYEDVNFKATVDLYDEFLRSRASSFIFISSIKAAVDHTNSAAVDEKIDPNPVTEYGKSKLKAEQYITKTGCPAGKNYYIFRPSVIYGPGNKGNMNLLHRFVKSGVPYPLGAYNNKRSFLFIDNICFALYEFAKNDYPSGIYHLSDGKAVSTLELIQLISQAIGKRTRVWSLPKALVKPIATIGSVIHLPLNQQTLSKLTENMVVANDKIEKMMGKSLPFDTKTGLAITYRNS